MSAAKPSTFSDLSVPDITTQIHVMHSRPSSYGGQSDVYTAFWDTSEAYTPVAIKVLRVTGTPDNRILRRLKHEISIWGRLSHPNLQRLLGVYFGLGPLPAMVSEWQHHGDITTFLKRHSSDVGIQDMKYRLLGEVIEAVVYLHDKNIIHGDIKGANVLVSAQRTALLSDFGFSTILNEHSRSFSAATAPKGTFRWMAPELFDEQESLATLTKASDIWAIGCLLIEVQSGQFPYHTKRNDQQVIIGLSKHELPPRP
ncbi:kinase-like protein, partial [Exidia glandulosa HHB12029]